MLIAVLFVIAKKVKIIQPVYQNSSISIQWKALGNEKEWTPDTWQDRNELLNSYAEWKKTNPVVFTDGSIYVREVLGNASWHPAEDADPWLPTDKIWRQREGQEDLDWQPHLENTRGVVGLCWA